MVDRTSADAEFGADLRLHHAVHITVQNGEFQSGKMQGFYNGIIFAEIGLLLSKAIHGIHGQRLVIGKINVIRLFGFPAQAHKFAVYFAITRKFDRDFFSFAVFAVNLMDGFADELILSHIFMDTQLLIIAFLRIRTLDKLFEATIALVNFRICN
mgnify:CR=1 FL=1